MSDDKKGFILYLNYLKYFELLTFEDRGKLITSLFDYSITGEAPDNIDGAVNMAFNFIRTNLDRDREKWLAEREKRSKAGEIGGIASGKARREKKELD